MARFLEHVYKRQGQADAASSKRGLSNPGQLVKSFITEAEQNIELKSWDDAEESPHVDSPVGTGLKGAEDWAGA